MRFICCCFNTVDRKQGVSKLNVSKIQKTYPAQGRGVAKYLCKKGVWGIHYIRNFIFSKRTAPNSKVIWSKIFLGGKNSVLSRKDMLFALNLWMEFTMENLTTSCRIWQWSMCLWFSEKYYSAYSNLGLYGDHLCWTPLSRNPTTLDTARRPMAKPKKIRASMQTSLFLLVWDTSQVQGVGWEGGTFIDFGPFLASDTTHVFQCGRNPHGSKADQPHGSWIIHITLFNYWPLPIHFGDL